MIVMDRPHLDFPRGQRAADRRVDSGEGKLLHRVSSLAQGDVERSSQDGQARWILRRGTGNTEGEESRRRRGADRDLARAQKARQRLAEP